MDKQYENTISSTQFMETVEDELSASRAAMVHTPDNLTLSEELSRVSSSPSKSQSSSCTSIINPFYDGAVSLKGGNNSEINQRLPVPGAGTSSEVRGNVGDFAWDVQPCPEEEERHGNRDHTEKAAMIQSRVILFWDLGYLWTCSGVLQILQLVFTMATLTSLCSAGKGEGGLLNLPLSWHFRVQIFILVLSMLVTVAMLMARLASLVSMLGLEWIGFDMVVYGLFSFLFMVGSSLVASAFDFYQKMHTEVSKQTIGRLVTSVILGYSCMALYGITAFQGYRRWKVQYRFYQRRKLMEEDEIDL